MDPIRFSIEKPVTVIVGIILVVLFGWIGLTSLPYQLSPSVIEPEITVRTTWSGATPYEIEREIIEEQEKVLKGIPGLVEMESTSSNSRGTITLKFSIGTEVDGVLLRVSNKLDEVRSYPENVCRQAGYIGHRGCDLTRHMDGLKNPGRQSQFHLYLPHIL
jgi:HAE1 family hydrophobic/amphiphilic exporter-1